MTDISADASAYYAGGFRRTFGGVPCKVFSRRTKDGRYINAKDSPFYRAEFDHPKKGASRTVPASGEVVEQIELKAVMDTIAASARETAEPRDNVLVVDFTPAMVAANDEAAELHEVRQIVRGGFGSTAARYHHPSPPAEVIPMPHNAPEKPVERDDAPEAAKELVTAESALMAGSGADAAPAPFKGLRTILAARDALQARRQRGPARERLLRRYLAMRAERTEARRRGEVQDILSGHLKWLAQSMTAKRARNLAHAVRLRRGRSLDRLALAAAGDMAREARDEATRAAAKPPQHPNDETADSALIAQLHRERAEAAAAVKAAEDREAGLRLAFDAATDRLADKLEEMTGRALRAEAEVRRGKMVPAVFCGSTVATARLAEGRLQ